MKMTKAQEDFLGLCWKMKVVNIIPQAAKLGIPEAEVRKYLREKGLTIEQGGFVFQGAGVAKAARGKKRVSDREFRRIVMKGYAKLKDAVREASELTVSRDQAQEASWRRVDDIRGELLEALEQLSQLESKGKKG